MKTVSLLAALILAMATTATGSTILMNQFGYLYETGGFPTSDFEDILSGVGVVTSTSPSINCDLSTHELTWHIDDLVSTGQFSPDGGKTIIASYSGGTIGLYCDMAMNHDFGTAPPNATAPGTFSDGSQFLIGSFTQFFMYYDTELYVGAFQGLVTFTTGSNLTDLDAYNGIIFSGTIGPELDPNIPDGYALECVGRISAPALCTVQGNVSYVYNSDECEKTEGITELVLHYGGAGSMQDASVSSGASLDIMGDYLIIAPAGDYKLPGEIVVTVGADVAVLNTSGAVAIEPGNEIGEFTVYDVGKIIVPCDQEQCEGITGLKLLYTGMGDMGAVAVSDGATVSVAGDLITVLPTGAKLPNNTVISVDQDMATIHTSCSQPLEIGFDYGEFEVVAVDKLGDQTTGATIPCSGPVVGVSVDLVDGEGNIYSTLTDENGDYVFYDAAVESLEVSIVVPLGYSPITPTDVGLVCAPGDVAIVDFQLERVATQDRPRSKGFWKHQVNSALRGKQNGVQVPADELLELFDQIHSRFDKYFAVFVPVETLKDFRDVLSPNQKASMEDKARGQFAAMCLNVVSNRLATWQFVSQDQATVSQAITHISDLILDGVPGNDELAKDLAEMINHGETIEAGVIPLGIMQIAYRMPGGSARGRQANLPSNIVGIGNYPNPFNPNTTIAYELRQELPVDLVIYSVHGQRTRTLVRGELQRGLNSVSWNGTDDSGRPVSSGVYFYRLEAGNQVVTGRMVMVQ